MIPNVITLRERRAHRALRLSGLDDTYARLLAWNLEHQPAWNNIDRANNVRLALRCDMDAAAAVIRQVGY